MEIFLRKCKRLKAVNYFRKKNLIIDFLLGLKFTPDTLITNQLQNRHLTRDVYTFNNQPKLTKLPHLKGRDKVRESSKNINNVVILFYLMWPGEKHKSPYINSRQA